MAYQAHKKQQMNFYTPDSKLLDTCLFITP